MEMFGSYLIVINIIGVVLVLVNKRMHSYARKSRIEVLFCIASLLGGSLGVLMAIVLFDRKANKENMMSRVWTACMFVIQVILYFMLQGHRADTLSFDFWTFFSNHQILAAYLVLLNILTFAVFAVDKAHARKGKARIRIVLMLGLAFAGGSLGGLLAMYLFRHKTKQSYFTAGIPLMIVMQLVVIFYMMNAKW